MASTSIPLCAETAPLAAASEEEVPNLQSAGFRWASLTHGAEEWHQGLGGRVRLQLGCIYKLVVCGWIINHSRDLTLRICTQKGLDGCKAGDKQNGLWNMSLVTRTFHYGHDISAMIRKLELTARTMFLSHKFGKQILSYYAKSVFLSFTNG